MVPRSRPPTSHTACTRAFPKRTNVGAGPADSTNVGAAGARRGEIDCKSSKKEELEVPMGVAASGLACEA